MLRKVVTSLVALVLMVGIALAEEVKGKVVKVDAEAKKITVSVDGKDVEYAVADSAKVVMGKKDSPDGLKSKVFSKPGAEVVLVTEKKDGKDIVTEIKVQPKKAK